MTRRAACQAGFTLLEVMIALTIMAVAFGAILTSQSGSLILSQKSKDLNIAGWLASRAMVENEFHAEGKPFTELDKVKVEKFPAPYERFQWKREIKELKFPDLAQPAQKEGQGTPEPVRLLMKTITKYLDDSVREMVITVTWQRGTTDQNLVVSTYLVDLTAVFNFTL